MISRILLISTVALLLLTLTLIYAGRIDDGILVNREQCNNDREYYNQYEKKCDLFVFYGPIVLGPSWIILLLVWIGVGKKPGFAIFS